MDPSDSTHPAKSASAYNAKCKDDVSSPTHPIILSSLECCMKDINLNSAASSSSVHFVTQRARRLTVRNRSNLALRAVYSIFIRTPAACLASLPCGSADSPTSGFEPREFPRRLVTSALGKFEASECCFTSETYMEPTTSICSSSLKHGALRQEQKQTPSLVSKLGDLALCSRVFSTRFGVGTFGNHLHIQSIRDTC